MKQKYTRDDVDRFPIVGGYRQCPSGDYTEIRGFLGLAPYPCRFEAGCVFGSDVTFSWDFVFGEDTRFGDRCQFGPQTCFSARTEFGNFCQFQRDTVFESGDLVFGSNCRFGLGCEIAGHKFDTLVLLERSGFGSSDVTYFFCSTFHQAKTRGCVYVSWPRFEGKSYKEWRRSISARSVAARDAIECYLNSCLYGLAYKLDRHAQWMTKKAAQVTKEAEKARIQEATQDIRNKYSLEYSKRLQKKSNQMKQKARVKKYRDSKPKQKAKEQ